MALVNYEQSNCVALDDVEFCMLSDSDSDMSENSEEREFCDDYDRKLQTQQWYERARSTCDFVASYIPKKTGFVQTTQDLARDYPLTFAGGCVFLGQYIGVPYGMSITAAYGTTLVSTAVKKD